MAIIEGARQRLGPNAGVSGNTTGYGPFVVAGTPVDGTVGSMAGIAEKGAFMLSNTLGKGYVNGGTLASPTWKLITSAA